MRKKTAKVDIIIIAVIILMIAGGILLAILTQNEQKSENTVYKGTDSGESITYKDYIGKRIGIMTGSSFEPITFEYLPDSEYFYYDSISDVAVALEQNKIDAFLVDEPVARMLHNENNGLDYIKQPLINDDYSFMFQKGNPKGDELRQQFNEMLAKFRSDGKLDEITNKWFGTDESAKTIEHTAFSGENGELVVAGMPDNIPFAYYLNNEFTGFAVEIITDFAQEYGYSVRFEQPNANAMLAGIISGKYDIAIGSISVTEERKESVDFSDTVYTGGVMLMVRESDISQTGGAVNENTPISYFGDKRIGILTGSAYEPVAQKIFPDAEYVYYDVSSDLALATTTGKIDGYLMSIEQAETMIEENPTLFWLKETAEETPYAFAFPKTEKGAALRDKINEFIAKIKADGTMDKLLEKWTKGDIELSVDLTDFTGENGELDIACDGTTPPWEYTYKGSLTGYEIELVAMFCREYGYTPDFDTMTFSAIIPGIASEKYDMAAANISVTPERAESVYFSDKESGSTVVMVTAAVSPEGSDNEETVTFYESIAASFEKNFIREDRWKLIVEGIGTTCLITVLSTLFGSVLAFLICMFRRTGSRLANAVSNIYVKLLQGTPIVVLLMILYYVILGKSGLEAVWVAVIGFTLNFGAYASEIMRSGIESIDGGQREAALALGYSENQAFFRFIFPQAAARFIPVYRQEIVSLLKSTSIVGYIAIQDLTKMSDIIRSRTYEAFFPLIATAVIYFVLAWVISLVINIILKAFDKRRKKGVEKKSV